ncbi:MAG: thermonuclease family protein [Phototrophicaceae bacterium]
MHITSPRWQMMLVALTLMLAALACNASPIEVVDPNAPTAISSNTNNSASGNTRAPSGQSARVTRVIDGDTIDVSLNGETVRVRYLGVNTTEMSSDDPCSQEGKDANRALVEGQTVTLVADRDPQDQYGRELRYVYVGNTFVNAELVSQGWAEAVMYAPNDAHWEDLIALEEAATRARRGCHAISDIFDDGRDDR